MKSILTVKNWGKTSFNMTLTFLNKYFVKVKSTSLVGSLNLFPPSFCNIWLLYISFDAKACKFFINVPKFYQLSVPCCDIHTIQYCEWWNNSVIQCIYFSFLPLSGRSYNCFVFTMRCQSMFQITNNVFEINRLVPV